MNEAESRAELIGPVLKGRGEAWSRGAVFLEEQCRIMLRHLQVGGRVAAELEMAIDMLVHRNRRLGVVGAEKRAACP